MIKICDMSPRSVPETDTKLNELLLLSLYIFKLACVLLKLLLKDVAGSSYIWGTFIIKDDKLLILH